TILPGHLTPEEAREACRSLKSSILRQEVYALDGTEAARRPYTVIENNYTIRPLQPRLQNRHAVFFTHARETVSFNYERRLYHAAGRRRADPRVTHDITLSVDDFRNVLPLVNVRYGRRYPQLSHPRNSGGMHPQERTLLTLTANSYTNALSLPDAYRTPMP